MAEQIWNSFARLNAGERFSAQSAEMGTPVTEAIVEAARIMSGLRVLDVACGSGEPAISIARLLNGSGSVTGVDLAGEPLKVARARAQDKGLSNLDFVQCDVHVLPFAGESFDRVTSRLGAMFFTDLAQALREMRRVLRPGGRAALLAWGPMEQPYFDTMVGTIRRLRPELEVPREAQSMFKFGAAGTLSRALDEAGFRNAGEELQRLRWDWRGTPEELWEYFRAVTVPFRSLLERAEGDAAVQEAVLAALNERYDGERVRFEAQMVLASGER